MGDALGTHGKAHPARFGPRQGSNKMKNQGPPAISTKDLARLAEIEKTLIAHDTALRDLYQKIGTLLVAPPLPPRRPIGFHVKEQKAKYAAGRGGK